MKHKVKAWVVFTVLIAGLNLLLVGCVRFGGVVDFAGVPSSGEPPLVVAFTPLVEGDIRSWLWDFGDGTTSTDRSPEHAYINPGTYSVTLTVEPRLGEPASMTKTDYITVDRRDMVVAPVFITFVNESGSPEPPTVFVFAMNATPTFDVLTDGIAWHVLPDVGKGASGTFIYPRAGVVQAMFGASSTTAPLPAFPGIRYAVVEDASGIVLVSEGSASQATAVEVSSLVHVNGVRAQLLRNDKVLLQKNIMAHGQKATFIVQPKLYWGIAEEIQEGQAIGTALLQTPGFFEQDLEGVNAATVTLTGNATDGYRFEVEND